MEEKKRTILAIVISCIILVAVGYSFGLNFFRSTTEIVVADPSASSALPSDSQLSEGVGGIPVEVTPDTVQSIIADMSRYKSYGRTIEICYAWSGSGSARITAEVTEHNGWLRCDTVLPGGMVEHSVVGDGSLWYWYDEGPNHLQVPFDGGTCDLIQHIPTYEDILEVDRSQIAATGYEEKNGVPSIFVEVEREALGYVERYWVSIASGLLIAAETEKEGSVVYSMVSGDVVSPADLSESDLTLPDGTVLSAGAD